MEQTPTENATPVNAAEPTVESNPANGKIAELERKNVELQAQKEHWREKYERDIVSQKSEEPVSSGDLAEDLYSEEGKILKNELKTLNEKFHVLERKEARIEAEVDFPILKERKEEFDSFLQDEENKRLSVKKAAKLFLAEQSLLVPEPPDRKGLEKPTSGGQPAPEPKLSQEEVQDLMKNNWREYEKLLRQGKI